MFTPMFEEAHPPCCYLKRKNKVKLNKHIIVMSELRNKKKILLKQLKMRNNEGMDGRRESKGSNMMD